MESMQTEKAIVYYSPKGLNISDMQLPPKVVWDLVLEINYESFLEEEKVSA